MRIPEPRLHLMRKKGDIPTAVQERRFECPFDSRVCDFGQVMPRIGDVVVLPAAVQVR
jgi:hypothetical protein